MTVPSTARRSNQSILKKISLEYSLEGLMLKLKLQHFGHLIQRADSLENPDAGKDRGQEEKGTTEDETVGWHHRLSSHGCEQTLGDSAGQGSLACCSPWGCEEEDAPSRMNSNSSVSVSVLLSQFVSICHGFLFHDYLLLCLILYSVLLLLIKVPKLYEFQALHSQEFLCLQFITP